MRSTYTRGPARAHLIHAVLARLRGRGWFSAHQAAKATYFGNGRLHRQQRRRVRFMLERYTEAGILEANREIAACTLYRHRDVTLEEVDQEMVKAFEKHAEEKLLSLRNDLLSGCYKPGPLRKTAIPKASGGLRILSIPCVSDRIVQTSCQTFLGNKILEIK